MKESLKKAQKNYLAKLRKSGIKSRIFLLSEAQFYFVRNLVKFIKNIDNLEQKAIEVSGDGKEFKIID